MIPALMGVPGKLKTLIDRLTAARASNLNNIDAVTMANLDAPVSGSKAVRKTQVFTTSGVWIKPAGVDSVHVLLVGAGAGAGGIAAVASYRVSGGGAGGQVVDRDLSVSGNLIISIGAGGPGGDITPTNGGNGGDSTITGGADLTAYGGTGGGYGAGGTGGIPGNDGNGNTGGGGCSLSSVNGHGGSGAGAGGHAPTPDIAPFGTAYPGTSNYGYHGAYGTNDTGRYAVNHGGPGVKGYGGGGIGGRSNSITDELLGGPADGAGAAAANANGGAAVPNSGGGGGGCGANSSQSTGRTGGPGADGICIVTWWE